MTDSTDTPQMAYLRRLAEKRNRAFEADTEFERQLHAAFRKTTGPEWTPPIRANEPQPDNDVIVHRRSTHEPFVSRFSVREGVSTLGILKPHSPAPVAWYDRVDWPEVLGTVCGVLIVVAIAGACCWAFLRATQGWAR